MTLLDTNVLLRFVRGEPLRAEARAIFNHQPVLMASAANAWELGLLATRTGRTGAAIGDARAWFEAAVARLGLTVLPVSAAVALEAAYLPEPFHRDPVDRWLVATARLEGVPLVTSDRAILAYAEAGHVRAIAC